MKKKSKKKAIILGAGPVGLVTAWKLLENSWEVDIYEKQNIVGGMCRTWQWGDFLVDTGPHIFHTPDDELAKFWEKEFGDLFIKGEFWCKNVQGENFDEYWDYPLSWESISRYPTQLKQKVLSELDSLKVEDKARAKSYKDYMEAQVGKTLYEKFFQKYPLKIWGIPTDEMTPDWAPKRIEFRKKVTPFYHNQWNAVGKYGTGCIFEKIKEHIMTLGGQLHFNKIVNGLSTINNKIQRIGFLDGKQLDIGEDDVVISSLPITVLSKFLGFNSNLQFRGILSVYLAYNQDSILPDGIHWLYYDSEKVFFNRITEPKKLSPYVSPEEKSYIVAEITYSKGDKIDLMPKEKLIELVAKQVEQVGLAKFSNLIGSDTGAEPFVYPVHSKGYQEEIAKTQAFVSKFQQLYSMGTGGEFNYADSQIIFHKAFDLVGDLCNKQSSFSQVIRQTPRVNLNRIVNLNGKLIGQGNRTYIIAEAGLNHNGSVSLAKQLVDEAKMAGCDAVKFQTFKASDRISKKVKSVKYAETIIGLEETLYDMFERLEMSQSDQREVFRYANEQGMEVFSTPFDIPSVDFLESLGVNVYKIASMDLVNLPLIRHVAKTGKPIIISCGMSTLGQIEEAVETVVNAGNPNLMLLHCNSSYPAAPEEMNLNVILTLKKCFNLPVGLSDHTIGLFVSQIAIAIGADIIERHFTLDRSMEGPDHILSSEPGEMARLVSSANEIPKILGEGTKRIEPNEYNTLNTQRKSLYAGKNILKDEIFSEENISIKGPGGGLLPKYLDVIVGKKANKNIEADHPISWSDF